MSAPRGFHITHAGFILVEIMIVVAIIALLAAIAIPGFLRARKRSHTSRTLNDLRLINGAVDGMTMMSTGMGRDGPVQGSPET